jgi:hypothetical protein
MALSDKQKKLAATAGNPKKIDAADFKTLRNKRKADPTARPMVKKKSMVRKKGM